MPRLKLSRELKRTPKGTCRWCHEDIIDANGQKSTRRTWHHHCLTEYKWESDENVARYAVERRDRGVCALCNTDTRELVREIEELFFAKYGRHLLSSVMGEKFRVDQLHTRGWNGFHYNRRQLWDMDHIVPLHQGGGHVMENLQTLCFPCHKKKTAQEAKQRAKTRREKAKQNAN